MSKLLTRAAALKTEHDEAILAAINKYGAKAIREAAFDGMSNKLDAFVGMVGIDPKNIGALHRATTLAFEALNLTELKEDRATAARELGRIGGRSTSPIKAAASKANGAKGGRPRAEKE